jgi:hypothetical protein
MDFGIKNGLRPGESTIDTAYSFIAEGDLGYMGAEAYFSGDSDDWHETARLTLTRVDQSSELLGPLKASQISVGDISPTSIPMVGGAGNELGLSISNNEVNRTSDFDTTRFEGNVQSGWDVELYQNGALAGSMRAGSDGKYIFEDIPVFYGKNTFQVIGYGPQGQKKVLDEEEIRIGSGMVVPDKLNYSFSLSRQESSFLGLEKNPDQNNSPKLSGKVEFGVNEIVSGTAGITSVEYDDSRHNYLQAGLRGAFNSWYGQADFTMDSEGGNALATQAQTSLLAQNVKLKQEFFSDFNRSLKSRNSLSLSGRIEEFYGLPKLSYQLSNTYSIFNRGDRNGEFGTRLAATLGKVSLSNTTSWDYLDDEKEALTGIVSASGSVMGAILRGSVQYSLGDTDTVDQFSLRSNWDLAPHLNIGTNVTKHNDIDSRDITTVLNLNWDAGAFTLSPSLSYDTESGMGAYLGLSFSLGKKPVNNDIAIRSEEITGKGAATAFVYHDANNNSIFDDDDQPIPEAEIRTRQSNLKAITDEQGIAGIDGMRSYNPVDVELDTETLQNPFWQPAVQGKAIIPRPGVNKIIEIPVITTGEIEGNIYRKDNDGYSEPLAKIGLEIYNKEGEKVQTTRSEFDGFFLFQAVRPGDYLLKVKESDLFRLNLESEGEHPITIDNDGTISSGNTISLRPGTEEDHTPRQSSGEPQPTQNASKTGTAVEPILQSPDIVSPLSSRFPPPQPSRPQLEPSKGTEGNHDDNHRNVKINIGSLQIQQQKMKQIHQADSGSSKLDMSLQDSSPGRAQPKTIDRARSPARINNTSLNIAENRREKTGRARPHRPSQNKRHVYGTIIYTNPQAHTGTGRQKFGTTVYYNPQALTPGNFARQTSPSPPTTKQKISATKVKKIEDGHNQAMTELRYPVAEGFQNFQAPHRGNNRPAQVGKEYPPFPKNLEAGENRNMNAPLSQQQSTPQHGQQQIEPFTPIGQPIQLQPPINWLMANSGRSGRPNKRPMTMEEVRLLDANIFQDDSLQNTLQVATNLKKEQTEKTSPTSRARIANLYASMQK